ncbi:MAG: ABC transporter ATP-binding protein, partial [Candidatus Zixiibacteriota bacterium]
MRTWLENVNAIEVRHLSYSFANGADALKDISFTVAQGERVGIIGPNGAGKSTLLWHLNGLLPERHLKNSAVTILGMPVVPANLAPVRAKIGLLFQNPDDQLFCPTVWEDVAFGPQQLGKREPELSTIVNNALNKAGLAGLGGRSTQHLSQGEKHRACLAGVLACEAQILVLDEPTSDLDPRGRREVVSLLRQLHLTQIIATHDLEFVVEVCSRVIVIDSGTVIADDAVSEILNDEEL